MKDEIYKITVKAGSEPVIDYLDGEKNLYQILLNETKGTLLPDTPCGGKGTCGKCKVKVSGKVSLPTAQEVKLLTVKELQAGVRLACQVNIMGDVEVSAIRTDPQAQIQAEGLPVQVALDPISRRDIITLSTPVAGDFRDDTQRISDLLGCKGQQMGISQLKKIARLNMSAEQSVCAVTASGQLYDVYPCTHIEDHTDYGVAVDIGTTTLVCYLVNLLTGRIEAHLSKMNAQRVYGADVISRISFCMENPEGSQILNRLIIDQIDGMIKALARDKGIAFDSVCAMTLAGNTTMMHLLMGLSPDRIAKAPFIPVFTSSFMCSAGELGFSFYPCCPVYLLPSISGYVGADIIAGMLACDLCDKNKVQLLVDIGTNGEMALSHNEEITGCSVAAGPAFEGACIQCGVGGIEGAIDAVGLNQGKLTYHTLYDKAPIGICGSGLVDMIALMVQHGIINEGGRFIDPGEWDDTINPLRNRMQVINNQSVFIIAFPDESAHGEPIYISQQDVREVQLAKAAVQAGIITLLNHRAITFNDIDTLWLAGGFGNKMHKESAVVIGLLPRELEDKIQFAGNTSGTGAIMALLSSHCRSECDTIKKEARYLELSGLSAFNEAFINAIGF